MLLCLSGAPQEKGSVGACYQCLVCWSKACTCQQLRFARQVHRQTPTGWLTTFAVTTLSCPAGGCQAAAAEARAKELQEELTATYKDKARVAEELVTAGRQLQIVRESNEAQARGLPRHLW